MIFKKISNDLILSQTYSEKIFDPEAQCNKKYK